MALSLFALDVKRAVRVQRCSFCGVPSIINRLVAFTRTLVCVYTHVYTLCAHELQCPDGQFVRGRGSSASAAVSTDFYIYIENAT